jgi:ABC-type dipeptide/oligopeptide/nickel transport system permease component
MSGPYLLKRLVYMALNLWVIITIAFLLFRLVPGNPADLMVSPLVGVEVRDAIVERLGLNDPLPTQYIKYIGQLLTGDFGTSYLNNAPVLEVVTRAFANTLVLVLVMFVISFVVGGIIGALLAWYRGTTFERVGSAFELAVRGAPTFFVGVMLILVFSRNLGWLPSTGMRSENFGETSLFSIYTSADFLRHLILPVAAGSIYAHVVPALLMRNTMLELREAEYLDLVRAKGFRESYVMLRHGVRNALMPMLAEASQFLGWAVGGLVAIEFVFSWPGLGREIVNALDARDYPVAQGALFLIAVLVMVVYFAADMLAAVSDPRTRRVSAETPGIA